MVVMSTAVGTVGVARVRYAANGKVVYMVQFASNYVASIVDAPDEPGAVTPDGRVHP